MKKIIFVVVCLCSVKVVNAEGLILTYLPYYVKVNDNEIIRVRRLLEVETDNVLFNTDIFNYQLTTDVSKVPFNEDFQDIDYFNTIIYFAYNSGSNKYENYFLAQTLIWELYCNLDFEIVDENGNPLDEYNDALNSIKEKINNHYKNLEMLEDFYEIVVGESINIPYSYPLEDLVFDGLSFSQNEDGIKITANKIGSYEINFGEKYKNNYYYSDGKYTYYAFIGEDAPIGKKITINVRGINLKIADNYKSINNKFGDSILESKYALYKDEELIKELNNSDSIEILPNVNYVLKDISNNKTINKYKDLLINLNSNYELNISKEIISKNIKINVLDKYTYNIYLKSNNELYEVINKNIKEIVLPYGLYYIVCKDIDFYDELEIYDDIPLTLKIDNNECLLEDDKNYNEDNNLVEDNNVVNNKTEDNENHNIKEDNEVLNDNVEEKEENAIINEISENPKTLDTIYVDLLTYLCCFSLMGISFKKIKE